jgi:hypothetical protein
LQSPVGAALFAAPLSLNVGQNNTDMEIIIVNRKLSLFLLVLSGILLGVALSMSLGLGHFFPDTIGVVKSFRFAPLLRVIVLFFLPWVFSLMFFRKGLNWTSSLFSLIVIMLFFFGGNIKRHIKRQSVQDSLAISKEAPSGFFSVGKDQIPTGFTLSTATFTNSSSYLLFTSGKTPGGLQPMFQFTESVFGSKCKDKMNPVQTQLPPTVNSSSFNIGKSTGTITRTEWTTPEGNNVVNLSGWFCNGENVVNYIAMNLDPTLFSNANFIEMIKYSHRP